MSLEDDLLNDFESDQDGSDIEDFKIPDTPDTAELENNFDSQLEELLDDLLSSQSKINQIEIDNISNPLKYLKVSNVSAAIYERLKRFGSEESDYLQLISYSDYENDEFKLLLDINRLIQLIDMEKSFLFRFIQHKYQQVFPELGAIINSPDDFIKVLRLIQQNLISIKEMEADFKEFLPNNKILLLIMSGLSNAAKQVKLTDTEFDIVLQSCEQYDRLMTLLNDLSSFIQQKLIKFTPNLSNLLGPITTSQLLIHTGSLNQLSLIPSCNLPSLGVKELSSSNKKVNSNIQMGYLFHNNLIKFLPLSVAKQSLRILSAKVTLAARIDLSKSSPDGELGTKYKLEVQEKLNKLIIPPDSTGVKPLPVPTDYVSKKRGGKKIRKMKERFQQSNMAKAQNKLKFGEIEESYVDSYGNEIGLGMIKQENVKVNNKTNATMSKSMKSRLVNDNSEKKRHLDSIFDDDFASIIKRPKVTDDKAVPTNKWINDSMTHLIANDK